MALRLNPITGQLDISSTSTTNNNPDNNATDITALTARVAVLEDGLVAITSTTTNYTATNANHTIIASAESNTVTVTLPASPDVGREIEVKCIDDTFDCDVDGNGNLIDGSTSNFDLCDDESITVIYDATNGWSIT